MQGDPLSSGDGCREAMEKRLFGKRQTTRGWFLSGDAHLRIPPAPLPFPGARRAPDTGPGKAVPGRSRSEKKTFAERLRFGTRSPDGTGRDGAAREQAGTPPEEPAARPLLRFITVSLWKSSFPPPLRRAFTWAGVFPGSVFWWKDLEGKKGPGWGRRDRGGGMCVWKP